MDAPAARKVIQIDSVSDGIRAIQIICFAIDTYDLVVLPLRYMFALPLTYMIVALQLTFVMFQVEEAALGALENLVLKLSETRFKPALLKIVEWGAPQEVRFWVIWL